MCEDGTWKKDNDCEDQIIALTTCLDKAETERELKNAKVTALATTAAAAAAPLDNVPEPGTRKPYAVAACWLMLIKGEDIVIKDRTTFHWCTKDHWSDDKKLMVCIALTLMLWAWCMVSTYWQAQGTIQSQASHREHGCCSSDGCKTGCCCHRWLQEAYLKRFFTHGIIDSCWPLQRPVWHDLGSSM